MMVGNVTFLWRLMYVLLAVSALMPYKIGFVRGLVINGKTRRPEIVQRLPGAKLLQLEVYKSAWTWFYLLGAVVNTGLALVLWFHLNHPRTQLLLRFLQSLPLKEDKDATQMIHVPTRMIVFVGLFALHTIRRFLESIFVTEFGNAKMHIGVLVLGCLHYFSVALSALSDPDVIVQHYQTADSRMIMAIGIALYGIASYHQSLCNYIIAKLKRQNHMQHVIPYGDWFDYVRSPLYTTEILLYVAFVFIVGGNNMTQYFTLMWVALNQICCAKLSSDWYDDKFRERKDKLPKWKLCPCVCSLYVINCFLLCGSEVHIAVLDIKLSTVRYLFQQHYDEDRAFH